MLPDIFQTHLPDICKIDQNSLKLIYVSGTPRPQDLKTAQNHLKASPLHTILTSAESEFRDSLLWQDGRGDVYLSVECAVCASGTRFGQVSPEGRFGSDHGMRPTRLCWLQWQKTSKQRPHSTGVWKSARCRVQWHVSMWENDASVQTHITYSQLIVIICDCVSTPWWRWHQPLCDESKCRSLVVFAQRPQFNHQRCPNPVPLSRDGDK